MKNLFIYHEGTGTLISLSDRVFLIDADRVDPVVMSDLEDGISGITDKEHLGYRLDNYNMTNLFFGE
jgi:hypothetical protein